MIAPIRFLLNAIRFLLTPVLFIAGIVSIVLALYQADRELNPSDREPVYSHHKHFHWSDLTHNAPSGGLPHSYTGEGSYSAGGSSLAIMIWPTCFFLLGLALLSFAAGTFPTAKISTLIRQRILAVGLFLTASSIIVPAILLIAQLGTRP